MPQPFKALHISLDQWGKGRFRAMEDLDRLVIARPLNTFVVGTIERKLMTLCISKDAEFVVKVTAGQLVCGQGQPKIEHPIRHHPSQGGEGILRQRLC